MRSNIHGLTLHELLVALTVTGVLILIAIPSLRELRQRTGTVTAMHSFTTALAAARIAAIKYNTPVSVCPSSDGRTCRGDTLWSSGWIIYADRTRSRQPAKVDAVLQQFGHIGTELELRSTSGRTFIRFHPNGMAHGSNISVRLCSRKSGDHLASVVVNNGGRARSERHRGTRCPFPT